ncbi:MAG: hypothetical protein LBQ52_09005 [Helicobacteraceae bacterium]|nr:hypothetical protein [Helicobacteraceae bacterium]
MIETLPHSVINLHIGYLPYNRGASPNIWSFIENTPCGVTIHEIDQGIDTGDILLQEKIVFDKKLETLASAYKKSSDLIQELFRKNWQALKNQTISPIKQPNGGSYHNSKALEAFKEAIDYNDTIETFLLKVSAVNKLARL